MALGDHADDLLISYCPECGTEVLNWKGQEPTWLCAHYPAWGEFVSWIRGNAGAIKADVLRTLGGTD